MRSYLAMAMGATQDTIFGDALLDGLKDESIETRIAAIQALGMIQYSPAVNSINTLSNPENALKKHAPITHSKSIWAPHVFV